MVPTEGPAATASRFLPYRGVRRRGIGLLAAAALAAACSSSTAAGSEPATQASRLPAFGPITPPTVRPVGTAAAGAIAAAPVRPAVFWLEAPILGDPSPFRAVVPTTGAIVEPGKARLLRPARSLTPRRVGIQVGHWKADEAPAEFPNLRFQFGASFDGVDEVELNLDIAQRVAGLLRTRGIAVDVLPATIPPGYLADAFVSLHADGDDYREARGFKVAHGFYRGPHEDDLVEWLTDSYAAATGLPWDNSVSGDMTDYYAFAWYRYEHALSPFTPAAILEMGFLSRDDDREVLLGKQGAVARGIAAGIIRFLAAKPQSTLFGQDIVVETVAPPK